MPHSPERKSRHDLSTLPLTPKAAHWNLTTAPLYEAALARGEAQLAADGPLVVTTGRHTGRSAKDKYIVDNAASRDAVWWGPVNQAMSPDAFDGLYRRMLAYLGEREVFVQDLWGGSDRGYRIGVRVITELAWHSLFARTMLIRPEVAELAQFVPDFTVIDAPGFTADPARDGTRSDTVIAVDFERRLVLIGGTRYAGEIKKSVFSILNFLLPAQGVMPMHCSANIGARGDVAIFFGLSGTGKTTLSADPARQLIGDDEHGWSDDGVFNFEGGCYAKMIRLSAEAEPQIYATTKRFGTVLENVVMEPEGRTLDLDDPSLAENSRGAYPVDFIDNHCDANRGGEPSTVIMLTADAFGVLPPVARLSPAQAMYHFLSGYTAKVAGTEVGVKEPTATFSTCFGAPFMPRHPSVYGNLLRDRIAKAGVSCWLINTGWTGGAYGTGTRMPIQATRALLAAALNGELDKAPMRRDPHFGFDVPTRAPGVEDRLLDPRATWADPAAYDAKAADLVARFADNFAVFEAHVDDAVRAAGPTKGQRPAAE
ncbi:phosphoenolpyruvate carboxykinase (ATP) [Rhodothalassium salexigens DSM 2132]|uniref:Phosphoenolpyruvate carboxykinase (ATP) n=1 Tax=Rhodothalassium salexigens DSM 2132 TaxID=1188247 RepID=A0A4R2PLA8_RHOSA|nr:phosphoenolpyruvate carboxykinase [Rhodothalassium salexigens]MBB4210962.1 phosphoenolpyruvate carboxykinase (ATP) [Rhodothalassium salexigens DSM 2132]TCP36380.1 phosphoenolpyruvate carboxykinase (ATP) [Rhodothalassium salexigens DSM 2132]